jgi:hypothetical protein
MSQFEGFCRWHVIRCNIFLLDFVRCLNYKIMKLELPEVELCSPSDEGGGGETTEGLSTEAPLQQASDVQEVIYLLLCCFLE